MKIVRGKKCEESWADVGDFTAGSVIEVKCPVNQYCKSNDVYVITCVPHCYVDDRYYGKISLVNLRTGGLSMVDRLRPCKARHDVEVCVPA